MSRSVTFLGAAQTVTGSRHLLELDGKKVLVDCGLFQGPRELRERNHKDTGLDAAEIDAVVLTHAHMDHIGYLPVLAKQGFKGPVYATPATIALARISLPDSGRIQEEDYRYDLKKGRETSGPLYNEAEAYAALKLLRPVHYFQSTDLGKGSQFRFLPAGHILGSAFAEVYFANGERILMGGDLGRPHRPILKDPTPVDFAEYLVLESTYGDRLHDMTTPEDVLASVIEAAVTSRGCVIVPSFAIGRTQELLWYIHELHGSGRIPRIPIYLDSPMATSVTDVYSRGTDDHDAEMRKTVRLGANPLEGGTVRLVRDRAMSKALNDMRGPMMVISGSGMLTGGRVLHHLRNRISDPTTTVLFTGYQAQGTPGRRLKDGADTMKFFGEDIEVRAQIRSLEGLSAHADQGETLSWLRGFKEPPRKTFLVHGEPEPQQVLAGKITGELGWDVVIPAWKETHEL
ncbi:MAG: MBL fold metallo-hydrolase RNA specificity domain-containing protein [Fimbriimonadaceae bacterium]